MAVDEVVAVAVIEDVGVVVEKVVVAGVGIEDEVGVGVVSVGEVVIGVGVEDFGGGWVLKKVVTEGDAVAGVVDELLVEVAVEGELVIEDEIGPAEEVQTLVGCLGALICFPWVAKGAMQPKLHLEETLVEAEHPDFGRGKTGSFGDQTQPAGQLVHCPFLFSPKGFHWCPNLPLLGCESQGLVWLALDWATSAGGSTHLPIRQPALPWGLDQGRG